ncbi:hypothetical protein [Streptomyces sp. SID4985]|uniref:hypothetical protein n=1 Tax=unclassified Streptomyces TaxID=2593676 RepID=UPI00136AF834|nr:hypothetical protein [Streptomyces sp. SID4985]MYQ47939.1 hypothetical protein [Streptomyces sp. SID4985]
MRETNECRDVPKDRWVFGLEEIPAHGKGADGAFHRVASTYHSTVISAPEGTPDQLRWAAEEIVDVCGPDSVAAAVLLGWLEVEAGDEVSLGVESCLLERVADDRIRLRAHYGQWDELVVPLADARRMLIDMMRYLTMEARHPLPSWRIRHLGERDWTQRRTAG